MCTRVKNLAKRGINLQTGHTPKTEKKKLAGNHQKTKRFSQILRKTRSFRKALPLYYNQRSFV